MRYAFQNFTTEKYSLLAGATYTVFFAIAVLFVGILADNISRKLLLTLAAIAWSLTSIGTSFAQTFWQLCLMRVLLGLFEACIGPPAYSLITDYFPPEKRTLANSVYSFGIYIGAALSNITILIIESIGWRETYFGVGCFGIFVGLLGLIIIKEPERGRFEAKLAVKVEVVEEEGEIIFDRNDMSKIISVSATGSEIEENEFISIMKDLRGPKIPVIPVHVTPAAKQSVVSEYFGGYAAFFSNKCCMWTTLGAMFRFWQGYTMNYY